MKKDQPDLDLTRTDPGSVCVFAVRDVAGRLCGPACGSMLGVTSTLNLYLYFEIIHFERRDTFCLWGSSQLWL